MTLFPKILVVLVFLAGTTGLFFDSLTPLVSSFRFNRWPPGFTTEKLSTGNDVTLSPSLTLILDGDPTKESEEARWRAVFQENPSSPLHFGRYLQKADVLPEDYRKTVAQIAPRNAWFDLWEIRKRSPKVFRQAVEQPEADENAITRYQILDGVGMANLISLFEGAAAKPDRPG